MCTKNVLNLNMNDNNRKIGLGKEEMLKVKKYFFFAKLLT